MLAPIAPAGAAVAAGASAAPAALGSGFWDGQVFKLRDFASTLPKGSTKNVDYVQTMGKVQLRYVLGGEAADAVAQDLCVEISCWELKVRAVSAGRTGLDGCLAALNGDLHTDVRRELSWWTLEKEANGDNVFTMELAKREHKTWNALWKVGMNQHRKSHFGWNPQQKKAPIKRAEEMLVRVRAGKPQKPDKDPFIINREAVCAGLEDGQDETTAVIRVHFDRPALEKACESVCLADLFGVDIMERYLKVFIRGDERSPILMGELAGACMPDLTRWEVVKAEAPDDQPQEPGKVGHFVSCLQITIAKAWESRKHWPRILLENESALEREAAPDNLAELPAKTIRPASPDRTGWGPAEHTKESKAKADACFKKSDWRDAAVYYTRAIGYTPEDEKLYSNRAACYIKLKKFEKALTDARKCTALKSGWPKAYFRQGQALRGLQRWEDAMVAFKDGQFRDPANADWEKEFEKTEDERDKFDTALKEQRRLRREADMTTELNEATVVAEREALVAVAEHALKLGKSRQEAGELAAKGAELAKQRVHEMAAKKKSMMVEDDNETNEPAPYRIVQEDGTVHPKGFCHTDKGTYYMGMVVMNAEKPPTNQPWVEVRHPGRLRWTQGCAQLRLKVTLPESVKSAADVDVKITTNSIRIGTVGDADPIVEGEFERKVEPEGENFAWYLIPDEKPPVLELTVDKAAAEVYTTFSYGTLLWPRLFNDDVVLGEGLFEADLTDLPPHLLEKWRREQARSNQKSLDDRERRKRLTEEEVMEETSRNWNDEFARNGMPTRFDTNEDRRIENVRV
mmetsp:Transcript_13053/g.35615  ORF Transcript_13053/g.35615 Transcript_13053/m.35615 type:complete len:800 (+) Transcript_13053:65-2464(+)